LAFLILNAGVAARYPPHRLSVKLARALASEGHVVLRFDLSGHGDSQAVTNALDPVAQGTRDLMSAMDHLQTTLGLRRFALFGACSGAASAYHASVSDARVVGVLMFDGYWYRSHWTRWVRDVKHLRAVVRQHGWRDVATRMLRKVDRSKGERRQGEDGLYDPGGNPSIADFRRAVAALSSRAAVFFVYSGSVIDYYSYEGQFRHVFGSEPWYSQVRCEFMPDVDHTILEQRAQRRFIDAVVGWLPAVQRAAERV
jgi:pimeloyl-ACP methyl ester carboxylesterase